MKRPSLFLGLFGLLAIASLPIESAHAQATRTWVSGVGDDANPCSRTAPCKTFAGAISKTATGGEINCLDPGGYGTLTITKSITIDCTGTFGSSLNSGGINGFVINDSASASPGNTNAVIRNVAINGAGTTPGLNGVRFVSGRSVTLENVTIIGQNGNAGISFAPTQANSVLIVKNSSITSNGLAPATGGGIVIQPSAGGTNALVTIQNSSIQRNGGSGILINTGAGSAIVTVRDSTISNNTNGGVRAIGTGSSVTLIDRSTINSNSLAGVSSEGNASTIRVGSSAIHGNSLGMRTLGSGVLRSYKNNEINGNGGGEGPFTQENLQ